MIMKNEQLLTTQEIAETLKVDVQTVRRWAREGDIPCIKIQVKTLPEYRFNLEEVLNHFKNGVNVNK